MDYHIPIASFENGRKGSVRPKYLYFHTPAFSAEHVKISVSVNMLQDETYQEFLSFTCKEINLPVIRLKSTTALKAVQFNFDGVIHTSVEIYVLQNEYMKENKFQSLWGKFVKDRLVYNNFERFYDEQY